MNAGVGFLPYLFHRARRHPPAGESDAQLVHVDPSVLVQVKLVEELGPEPLALGIDPAVLTARPGPAALTHDDVRAPHTHAPRDMGATDPQAPGVPRVSKKGAFDEITPLASAFQMG